VKLSLATKIKVTDDEANVIGHMCYSASKLWNICNYQRHNYKELGLEKAPTWYTQKKEFKGNLWFKNLPSQSAQEVCKLLSGAWSSFYTKRRNGDTEAKPPRFKKESIAITYMQNGIQVNDDVIRLTIPKVLKAFMRDTYNIDINYLYLRNSCFQSVKGVKQVKLHPPERGCVKAIIVYEIADTEMKPNNERYLSIDLGVHNFMTCYDNVTGGSFIVGRKYLSITRKYDKEIGRVQSEWHKVQYQREIKHPKGSKHISALYAKKRNCIKDYLHKMTKYVVDYCVLHEINTVVIGDITGIREGKDFGNKANQEFHALPYLKLREMLEYKLNRCGIGIILQWEGYSSRCSPLSPKVSKRYSKKKNRVKRGLYKDAEQQWNADTVGAYNILRLYFQDTRNKQKLKPLTTVSPVVAKVAV
jgi:putative transposase